MSLDAGKADLKVGVVGTGTMGCGIAQIAAQAGIVTLLFDANPGAVDRARTSIATVLGKQVDKGKLTQVAVDATLAHLRPVASLQEFAACDIVIEAVAEKLEIKCAVFKQLEDIVRADAILATNTSSLSVTALAATCKHPGRIAGCHFFNPVPLMKIVEIVNGAMTETWVGEALKVFSVRMGHSAVLANDMPGFIVNHAGRGFVPESLRVVSEGIADFYTIDRIMKETCGFRMGPFELQDMIGWDVGQLVMESIYDQFYQEPRFKVTPLVAQRTAAGLLGRKVQRGVYDYSSGALVMPPESPAPAAQKIPVWVSSAQADGAAQLRATLAKCGAIVETGSKPSAEAIIMVTPLGKDTTTCIVEQGLDASRTVAVDTLFGLDKRRTLMSSPATAQQYLAAAHGILAADGVPVSVIRDSAGFVAQRVVAMIVSIGCDIAQQRIASPRDIDLAVKMGLSYPHGPLGMGDAAGAGRILTVLENMSAFYQEPRYRPGPWLKRRALLGLSLLTED